MSQVGKRLRFAVLERDHFRCRYCGIRADDGAQLHVDHIHPRSKGGTNDLANLVTACADCNLGKSDRVLLPVGRKTPPKPKEKTYSAGARCMTPYWIAVIGQRMRHSYKTAHAQAMRRVPLDLKTPYRDRDRAMYWDLAGSLESQREAADVLGDILRVAA